MVVVFLHGWGVHTPDYGALPRWLAARSGVEPVEVWLSDYVSYSDSVTVRDLARGLERARLERFDGQDFACVTHSTGGPVVREWLDEFGRARACGLTHLVMLAPPNH